MCCYGRFFSLNVSLKKKKGTGHNVYYSCVCIDTMFIAHIDIPVYTEKVSGRITRNVLPAVAFEGGTEKKIRLTLHLIWFKYFCHVHSSNKYLLGASRVPDTGSRCWGYNSEQNRQKSCSPGADMEVGET